jgi:hypothetical protein
MNLTRFALPHPFVLSAAKSNHALRLRACGAQPVLSKVEGLRATD